MTNELKYAACTDLKKDDSGGIYEITFAFTVKGASAKFYRWQTPQEIAGTLRALAKRIEGFEP